VWDTIVGNNSSGNSNSGNILVHCSDGMQRSGILLTLVSLIQVHPYLAIISRHPSKTVKSFGALVGGGGGGGVNVSLEAAWTYQTCVFAILQII
jgi:hypothetical protein